MTARCMDAPLKAVRRAESRIRFYSRRTRAVFRKKQFLPGLQQPILHQRGKPHPRRRFFYVKNLRGKCFRLNRVYAFLRRLYIFFFPFQTDPISMQAFRHSAGRAASKKRIENRIAGLAGRKNNAIQQGFGLLRRMRLIAVIIFDSFRTRR